MSCSCRRAATAWIFSGSTDLGTTSTIESILYGRDGERARIKALLDRTRTGHSGVLVVRGDAGVGKSALLDLARAEASGMLVLSCEGVESESRLPYAGLHQLVRPILDHLDALPAPQARALRGALGLEAGVADQWFLVSAAALSLLAEAAEDRPLLCLIDDAHWLDPGSAEALVFAARRLEAERIAVLFTAREGDPTTFDAPGLDELRLGGLDPGAAASLLDANAGGRLAVEARARLIEETGGNPLALLALSSAMSEAQLSGSEPLLKPVPVSARVERVFLERVRRLPSATQSLLLVASTDDTGELAIVLRAASRLGVGAEALDAAEHASLVRVAGTRIDLGHPLIRSAVYHGAPLSERHAVHRALADVLVGESHEDRRVWHLMAGSPQPDANLVRELEAVAERARLRSAFLPATSAFERAAATTADDTHRLELLQRAVESAWFAGRLEWANVLIGRARPLADSGLDRAKLSRWRALIELTAGVPGDARDVLISGAAEIASHDPEQALHILAIACLAAGYPGDVEGVAGIAERAAKVPAGAGPVGRFLRAFVLGMAFYLAGAAESAAANLRQAVELADEADRVGSQTFFGLLTFAGTAALFLGEDRAAGRINRRLVSQARQTGALTLLVQSVPRVALTEIATGSWAAATASLKEGIELARQAGQHPVVAHMLSELALIEGRRGNEKECRALAAESRELASVRQLVHVGQTSHWALLGLELGRGDAEAALVHARRIIRRPVSIWAALDRIEAAARASDSESAERWLSEFGAWAEAAGTVWEPAVVLHCRALLAKSEDEIQRAFQAALEAHEQSTRSFLRARTEFAFGEHLRRARRRIEARKHLRAALDGFEALGARGWAERVRIELRASGQTVRRRDLSTRDELSPQEVQIARFVAQGLSNREVAAQLFLSPRTIDFHLRNIFRKLGITSRMQLAPMALDPEPHEVPRRATVRT